jgi:drug/metabolite transporter (DMT)-like permease
MQKVSMLPPMSFMALGYLIVLLLILLYMNKRIKTSVFNNRILWVFALVITVRAITGVIAVGYTLAMYTQLLDLMAPFFVVLLSATFFKDHIPKFTGAAITLSLIGGVLMLSNRGDLPGIHWSLTSSDWIGISLAAFSSFTLSLYMVILRRSLQHQVAGEMLFLAQAIGLILFSSGLSLVWGEDWGRWLNIGFSDWLAFAAFVLVALLFSNIGQILALKRLSAPFVSSFLTLRLVGAVIGGILVLGENFTSIWQVVGTVIVLVTLTIYMKVSQVNVPEQAVVKQ